jgi:hypothetical protein
VKEGARHNFLQPYKPGCETLGYFASTKYPSVISGFRRNVDEICVLLGYYAPLNGRCVSTFRDSLSVPFSRVKKSKKIGPFFKDKEVQEECFLDFFTPEYGTDRLSRNVGKGLPFYGA